MKIIFIKVSHSLRHFLTKEHRKYITENIYEIKAYHHIGFFENDIGFNLGNINYYFYTLNLLKVLNLENAIPGFKRYEISKCSNGDIWRSCQDHIDNITFYNIKQTMFVRIKQGFSAMWILPIEKVMKYIKEKEFLYIPDSEHDGDNGIKPYYSYYYWEKHYYPLIPLHRIDDCFIHHMSNKYVKYFASIQLTELYRQMNICREKNGLHNYGKNNNYILLINKSKISKKCVELEIC